MVLELGSSLKIFVSQLHGWCSVHPPNALSANFSRAVVIGQGNLLLACRLLTSNKVGTLLSFGRKSTEFP